MCFYLCSSSLSSQISLFLRSVWGKMKRQMALFFFVVVVLGFFVIGGGWRVLNCCGATANHRTVAHKPYFQNTATSSEVAEASRTLRAGLVWVKTSSSAGALIETDAAFHFVTRATCNILFSYLFSLFFFFWCVCVCARMFFFFFLLYIWSSSAATPVRERLAVCCSIIRSVSVGRRGLVVWSGVFSTRPQQRRHLLCRFCTILFFFF